MNVKVQVMDGTCLEMVIFTEIFAGWKKGYPNVYHHLN